MRLRIGDKWKVLVNTIIKIQFPYNFETFLVDERLMASERGVRSEK
jgi:hypothetical protein